MPTTSGRSSAMRTTLVAEHGRPAGRCDRRRVAGLAVERWRLVHLVVLVGDRDVVALALGGDDVHEDGSAELAGLGERVLEGRTVVSVDRADVLEAEILEHALRGERVLDALLDGVQGVVRGRADAAGAVEAILDGVERRFVLGVRADLGEPVGEPAHGRGVRAAVVVDDDHEATVLAGGDVVERLPGHAAGEGAVADDGHDVVVLAEDLVGLRHAVGVGEARGRVGVLDPVVLGLGLARVAGQAALLAQRGELAGAAGEHLVHVRLVAGVPDDAVARGVEDTMDGHAQLDDAEVGAEVAAVGRDRADQQLADLLRELGQLLLGEPPQVGGSGEGVEHGHSASLTTADEPADAVGAAGQDPPRYRPRTCVSTSVEVVSTCSTTPSRSSPQPT